MFDQLRKYEKFNLEKQWRLGNIYISRDEEYGFVWKMIRDEGITDIDMCEYNGVANLYGDTLLLTSPKFDGHISITPEEWHKANVKLTRWDRTEHAIILWGNRPPQIIVC